MTPRGYLFSTSPFATGKDTVYSCCILFCWLALVIVVSSFHELWKDEVRALSLALSADSLFDLPVTLKNEGHPILWYLLLRMGYWVARDTVVLQVLSVVIAFAGVTVFYRYAPFPIWWKILFLFGMIPAYEYSVMARNYGIGMLLFFGFAALYPKRKEVPVALAIILALLANTNIHSTLFVCWLALLWFVQIVWYDRPGPSIKGRFLIFLVFFLVCCGVIFSVWTVLPDEKSVVARTTVLSFSQVLGALFRHITHPGSGYDVIFLGLPLWARDALLWFFCLGLLVKPVAAFAAFGGAVMLGMFFELGYQGVLRHQGIFFIYAIVLYWLVWQESLEKAPEQSLAARAFRLCVLVLFPLVFLIHLAGSYQKISRDFTMEMSSSKAFGRFLHGSKNYQDAIIIGEPDIRLESLPYYAGNPIYLPREKRFQKYVRLTTDNRDEISLGEILAEAQQLQASERRPVLIALGHFGLDEQLPPYIRSEAYGKRFTWSVEELRAFKQATTKVAEFKQDVENERYEIYSLKSNL